MDTSIAKKNQPLSLGALLVLTHIIYYANDALHHLSPLIFFDQMIPFITQSNMLKLPQKRREAKQMHAIKEKEEDMVPLKKKVQGQIPSTPTLAQAQNGRSIT